MIGSTSSELCLTSLRSKLCWWLIIYHTIPATYDLILRCIICRLLHRLIIYLARSYDSSLFLFWGRWLSIDNLLSHSLWWLVNRYNMSMLRYIGSLWCLMLDLVNNMCMWFSLWWGLPVLGILLLLKLWLLSLHVGLLLHLLSLVHFFNENRYLSKNNYKLS